MHGAVGVGRKLCRVAHNQGALWKSDSGSSHGREAAVAFVRLTGSIFARRFRLGEVSALPASKSGQHLSDNAYKGASQALL